MSISSIVSRIIPATIGYATGGPVGAFTAVAATESAKREERKIKRQNEQVRQQQARFNRDMAQYFDQRGGGFTDTTFSAPSTQQSGFGAGFGSFLSDVGRNIVNPFTSLATAISPFFNRGGNNQPAITTTGNVGGQETQGSGTVDAFSGGFIGPAVNTLGRFLKTPTGSLGTGLLGGLATNLLDSGATKMRITRKMKSQARMVLNMVNGNTMAAAQILEIDERMLIAILLKRFRNDGPVVTKAALRKTKQTVRRLKNMCDMYDSLRPTATRRRTPMKRASTTLISNK